MSDNLERFENLDDMGEMLEFLCQEAEGKQAMPQPEHSSDISLTDELCSLNMQVFLKFLARFKNMPEDKREALEEAAEDYVDTGNDTVTRHGALIFALETFFPKEEEKKVSRKNDSVYQTPCEDCNGNPTHLIQFVQENRIEEHFLCENCESQAMKE
jgi:hypothetical protein